MKHPKIVRRPKIARDQRMSANMEWALQALKMLGSVDCSALWKELQNSALPARQAKDLFSLAEALALYQDTRLAARCRKCGCTDMDCSGCIERTGGPCHWVSKDLCSACVPGGGKRR